MLNLVLSVVALAGALATMQPAFADALPATAPDHAQAAASVVERPASTTSASPDATAPADTGLGKGIIPVGFGWG